VVCSRIARFLAGIIAARWVGPAGDLLTAVGQFLIALGLGPDVRNGTIDFLFLNRLPPDRA
jgi:hypothetical protein